MTTAGEPPVTQVDGLPLTAVAPTTQPPVKIPPLRPSPRHAAAPAPGPAPEPVAVSANPPTQTQFPGRAVARTTIATLITAITILNTVVPAVVSASPSTFVWLNTFAVIIASISGIITRIMAIPQVDELLRAINLSASK